MGTSLARGAGGPGDAYSGIHLEFDEIRFPDSQWTDLVVPVAAWFADAVTYLLSGGPDEQAIHFMEGPYLVRLAPLPSSAWRVTLVEAGANVEHVVREGEVDPEILVESIVHVAETLVERYEEAHGASEAHGAKRDLLRLEGLLLRLRAAFEATRQD